MAHSDTLICGAKVVDGTGNPWFYGDVLLKGARIAEVTPPGRIQPSQAYAVVDASGMVVCPGFIDIHSQSALPLMIDGSSLSKITQGVTTEIMGESWTPAPFGGRIDDPIKHSLFSYRVPDWEPRAQSWGRFRNWLEAMIAHGVSPNIGSFLGGGTLRMYARGMEMGAPSVDELATMCRVVREAMKDGAMGVAYALIYAPDAYASTDELVAVSQVAGEYGGIYITHLRSEGDRLIAGIGEALEVGRRANLPVEIYHLKASGQRNWHKMGSVIALIDRARAEGLDVTANMYPYSAAGSTLMAVLPPWAAADGEFFGNLVHPEVSARIRAEAQNPSGDWEALVDLCGLEGVMPIGLQQPENQQYVGKRLSGIAAMRQQEWVDAVFDLLLSEKQRISTIYFLMNEENLELQLKQPWLKISTDAGGLDPTWAKARGPCHPRAYGTYTRVLGKYVREEGVLTLEDAVRKMSSAVAERLGLSERGLLRKGCYADIVIFNPETVGARATFEEPHQLSVGVRDVWVNGVRVLADGVHTGAKPGRIVDGPGRV